MGRSTIGGAPAYRAVVVLKRTWEVPKFQSINDPEPGTERKQFFGPYSTLAPARAARSREANRAQNKFWNVLDAYVERADNWNRVLDTDQV